MSGLGATLAKKVGPMPLGVWLIVGGGGLFIAYKSNSAGADSGAPVAAASSGDALPTGGGYPSGGAVNSFDGAPVVLSPIIQLPRNQVQVNVTLPAAPVAIPAPPKVTPHPTPTVPPRTTVPKPHAPAHKPATAPKPLPKPTAKPKPMPKHTTVAYTVKKGDTLWAIAAHTLGAGYRWPTIYGQNRTVIESTARRYGKSSSANGHWIYPGTLLRITK